MINKLVYSHWSKPAEETHVGFNSEAMFIASLYLSVRQNGKWIKNTELVTDRAGEELIINKYGVPFKSVSVTLDEINHIDKRHWAIGKIEACRKQTEPFIHVDNDVFWFKRIPEYILNAQACFQNIEKDSVTFKFYEGMARNARRNFKKAKPFVDYSKISAVNCGIIGFNDLSFIEEWADYAYEYIDHFDTTIMDLSAFKLPSLMFEQFHLYYFLEHYGFDVKFVAGDNHTQWITPERAEELGYTHLISASKRNHAVEKRLLDRLKHDYYDFYKKLKSLNEEEITKIEQR